MIGSLEAVVEKAVKSNKIIAIGGAALFLKPMEIIREIIRQGINDLIVYTLIGDVDIDLLLGVKAIKELHSSYVGMPMIGMAKNFRLSTEGQPSITFQEWTELSMIRAYQAGALGAPILHMRSLLGSELVSLRDDFQEVDINGKIYVQIPALTPDLAIVHGWASDHNGNIFYPKNHLLDEFSTLPALCADELLVSVEKLISNEEGRELVEQGHEVMFSSLETNYVIETPRGAWPSGFPPFYASDMGHIMMYSSMANSPETFLSYLDEYVINTNSEGV